MDGAERECSLLTVAPSMQGLRPDLAPRNVLPPALLRNRDRLGQLR